ncbi:NACHT, LRR and PYD domains-containing protein 1 [Pteropus alecto]|uniref:NACHT, LRR and PYD domains-containing protein 1 n=1 Tax=Pteropus alecto TaxID=9402 RepID=L5KWQ1_PTEAL|nr:NACHT, LRR and PYD domains-containing protein 1 [Pteropus alecto]
MNDSPVGAAAPHLRRWPRLKVDAEGIYECTETGLIFEVNRKVDIKYCVLSWSKYADLVVKPWAVGGPLFDVKCDPTCLTSIQFPHSLCLGHHDSSMTFRVFHVKRSGGASLEYTVDHSASHVKWHVSSLSPVGPVIQSEDTLYHHGAVILYKVVDHNPSLSLRVYIATNNDSFIKDISKSVKHSSKKFMKIDKPPVCQKLLQNGKKYRLISEPEADITPEEIEFVDGSLLKLKSYIEVYLEQPVEFKLLLVETDSEEIVWKAKLRECDWVQHEQSRNVSKSSTGGNRRRKMSSTLPDEEVYDKRMKQTDTSGAKTLLTDTQLLTLAGKLGKEWIKIAIVNLELDISDIDAIREKEEDVTVYKFQMLKKWQEKEQNNATVQNLYNCLEKVSVEIRDVLEGAWSQAQLETQVLEFPPREYNLVALALWKHASAPAFWAWQMRSRVRSYNSKCHSVAPATWLFVSWKHASTQRLRANSPASSPSG